MSKQSAPIARVLLRNIRVDERALLASAFSFGIRGIPDPGGMVAALVRVVGLCLALCSATMGFAKDSSPQIPFVDTEGKAAEIAPGVHHYGVYLNGRVSVGVMTLVVQRADKGGFSVSNTWKMRVLGSSFTRLATAQLKEDLGILDWTEIATETMREAVQTKTTHLSEARRNKWAGDRSANGQVLRAATKGNGLPHHGLMESLLVLAPTLYNEEPGVYRASEIFLDFDAVDNSDWADWRYFELQVHETSEFQHRGKTANVRVIRAIWPEEKAISFVVSEKGELLSFWTDEVPVRFVLGRLEEVALHMPLAESILHESDPRVAVRTFFEVMAKARPAHALDEIVDWTAVIQELGKEPIGPLVDSFSKAMKAKLEKETPAVSPEEVPLILGMLDVELSGDEASVRMEGRSDKFQLRRTDGKWLIVAFPK